MKNADEHEDHGFEWNIIHWLYALPFLSLLAILVSLFTADRLVTFVAVNTLILSAKWISRRRRV